MVTTAALPRARIASLAVRARNIVDSGLYTRMSAVPDWLRSAAWTNSST
ncbi:hypothetical protein [Streptomyces chartreusis]